MKKLTENMMKKAQQSQGGFTYTYGNGSPFGGQNAYEKQRHEKKSDSKVHVDYVPQVEEQRKGAATAGEFIDFEEVK